MRGSSRSECSWRGRNLNTEARRVGDTERKARRDSYVESTGRAPAERRMRSRAMSSGRIFKERI